MSGIVIEGLDLVGKSTLARSLAERIPGARIVESPQGEYRRLLRGPAPPVSPISRLALYISANIEIGVEFARADSPVIVVRHLLSTVVHHALANDESPTRCLSDLDYLLRHCPLPDALIVVEASHAERVKRAAKAAPLLTDSDNWTLDPDVHVKTRRAYRELANGIDMPVLFLDTTEHDAGSTARSAYSWLKSRNLA